MTIKSEYPVILNENQKDIYDDIMKVLTMSQNFHEIKQHQNYDYEVILSYNIGYNLYNITIYIEGDFSISIICPYENSSLDFYESIDNDVIKKILNK